MTSNFKDKLREELFGNSQLYGRKFFLSRDRRFLAFDQSLFLVPLIGMYIYILPIIIGWLYATKPTLLREPGNSLHWFEVKKSIAHGGCFQWPSFVLRSRSPEVAGTPQKLFGSTWKMDGWNTSYSFPFGAKGLFLGAMFVNFKEGTSIIVEMLRHSCDMKSSKCMSAGGNSPENVTNTEYHIPSTKADLHPPKKSSDKDSKWKNNTQKRRVCSLECVSVNIFFFIPEEMAGTLRKLPEKKRGDFWPSIWEFLTPRIHHNLRFTAVKWSSVRGVFLYTTKVWSPVRFWEQEWFFLHP